MGGWEVAARRLWGNEEGEGRRLPAWALVLAWFLLLVLPAGSQEIGILRSMQADAFAEAVTAFKATLSREFPEATYTDLGVVVPGWQRRIRRFQGEAFLAVGSRALEGLLNRRDERPVGFTMVLHPCLPADRRTAGAAMEASAEDEVALIHRSLPELRRAVGLVFKGAPCGWGGRTASAARGAGLTWRVLAVDTIDELPKAVHQAAPFDLLFLPPEPALLTPRAFRVLVRLARREAFGLVAPSPPFVRAGAAAAVEVSWAESGRLAAVQMARLLHGEQPSHAVLHPRPLRLWIHRQRAHDLRWVPQSGTGSPQIHLWEDR